MIDLIDIEVFIWVSSDGIPNLDSIGYSIENLYNVTRLHATGGFYFSPEKRLDAGCSVEKVKLTIKKGIEITSEGEPKL